MPSDLTENAIPRRKQRYIAHRIYILLREEDHTGAESTQHGYVAQLRVAK